MRAQFYRFALSWFDVGVLALLFISSPARAVLTVSTSPEFFNPSIGRSAQIHIVSSIPGRAVVEILDRDNFLICSLAPVELISSVEVPWDGKDGNGVVVPNEAYSIRVRFESADGRNELYDPAAALNAGPISIDEFSYSRVDGVLNYRLSVPSRVHIQAGQKSSTSRAGTEGPILQTVVDREPRARGAISEKWNGFDESRAVYVPDLPGFVMAILAAPLPANSLIATGSRGETFASYAARHRPSQPSLRAQVFGPELRHHQGLSGLQDRSPRLTTQLLSGEDAKTWQVQSAGPLAALIGLEPAFEPVFLTPRARLYLFSDAKLVATETCDRNPCPIELPAGAFAGGQHRFVANWDSGLGPVGVAVKIVEAK